jgi:E3 ubiquitin-protein ligase SIAH1
VKLPGRRCRTCRDRGAPSSSAYAHCPALDLFFTDLRVPCDFQEYGCESFVSYFLSTSHRDTCEHAPCHCPEPGCPLVRSPQTLAAHLACDHSWPVEDVAYGAPIPLAVPVPAPPSAAAPARRSSTNRLLLRGDDASLFLMAAGPLGDGGGAAVSVVLVRATARPTPPLPRFTCTFYANPPPGAAELAGSYYFATVPVRSSALADGAGVAPEKELYFAVPREMLHGGNRELFLSVRIDRSPGPEPASEDKSMMITDHSNLHTKINSLAR